MEFKIQKALKKLLEGRVCFVAAHRLSTIKSADQILVVENGLIAERGNHEELIAQNGIYSNFYNTRFRYLVEEE